MPIADPMEVAGAGVFACSRTDPLASALYGARVECRRGASDMGHSLTTAPALAHCASPLRRDKLVRQRRPRSTRSIITAAKKACSHLAAAAAPPPPPQAAEPLVTKPLHDPPDVLYMHRLGVPPQLQGVLQPGAMSLRLRLLPLC
ncbi:hypothetical protein PSV08DRAFT_397814 [Bipolaris maydis]|uniref:uncharacterized protein n=1 Tax=Cochliobolus heterostrophus TaxID=5016 RepID=UPI0024D1A0E5|nr:hypothetical protein J3E73DRAFT_427208 [Bipolaris maydis]KAJ6275559.1 hypothetical protein PSV08DRAFT_397814 [Bipolaris maydis]